MELTEKKCSQCGRILPINNFIKNRDRYHKIRPRSECKECFYAKRAIRREKERQKRLEKQAYEAILCNIGYYGCLKTEIDFKSDSYLKWRAMINRCYNDTIHKNQPTYIECTVCEEWLNYSNFKKWFETNYYNVDNERMDLDKDILVKDNKVYSPETCIFVPHSINVFFSSSKPKNGRKFAAIYKQNNKFFVQIKYIDKLYYLGNYNTIDEAFKVYKKEKEKIAKEIANKYKNMIPDKLYNILINFKVEEEILECED